MGGSIETDSYKTLPSVSEIKMQTLSSKDVHAATAQGIKDGYSDPYGAQGRGQKVLMGSRSHRHTSEGSIVIGDLKLPSAPAESGEY